MKVKFSDLSTINRQVKDEAMSAISSLIDDSSFIDGKTVRLFEEKFAEFCGVKYCVCVNNGTSALHLALKTVKSFQNKKVATAPNSFFATAEAISYCNLDPLFVDVDFKNFNINTEILTSRVNEYDGIMPISLYGNPCDLTKIKNLTNNNDKFLIHDACQAHGAEHNGKKIAQYSDLTCFSFYPSKNLGTFGEGGAIVTDNKALYEELYKLKQHGQKNRHDHEFVGFNYRLNEIQAAVLLIKLKYLNEWTEDRIRMANRYNLNLKSNKKIRTLQVNESDKCVYHLYPIFTPYKKEVTELFSSNQIEYSFHYPVPIYSQKAYSYLNANIDDFPATEVSVDQQISLPLYVGLPNEEIDYVCDILNKI